MPSSLILQWFYLPTPILHTREGGGPKILKFWSEIAPCGKVPVYDPSPAPPLSPVFWGVGKGTSNFSVCSSARKLKTRNQTKDLLVDLRIELKATKFCVLSSGFTSNPHSTY